jgi:hypothetical protein
MRTTTIITQVPIPTVITEAEVGPQGKQGEQGGDSVIPGPQGPPGEDSIVPGPQGLQGPQGESGINMQIEDIIPFQIALS